MKFTLRINNETSAHVRFTVFVDGGNAGDLCMRTNEFETFAAALAQTNWDEYWKQYGKREDAKKVAKRMIRGHKQTAVVNSSCVGSTMGYRGKDWTFNLAPSKPYLPPIEVKIK